jgi:hypothetical protein
LPAVRRGRSGEVLEIIVETVERVLARMAVKL